MSSSVIKGTGTAEEVAGYAGQLVGAAFASGKFMFADTDLKIDLPQVRVAIDRERVADLGLDLAEVGRQLGILLAGDYVNRFTMDGRTYKVIPQVGRDAREVATQLLDYKIQTRDGTQVPFSAVARLETSAAPRTLARFQQADSFRVYGGVVPGVTKAEGLATLEAAARAILPAGYTIDYAGESRQIRQEGTTLVSTLAFAVLLIYLVLAAQFGSFRDPLVVLLGSVPLALSGALVFTFLGFTTINIYSQIGLITLVGLIAKNGILIVEFANRLQEQHRSQDRGDPRGVDDASASGPDDHGRHRVRSYAAGIRDRGRGRGAQQHRHHAGDRDDDRYPVHPVHPARGVHAVRGGSPAREGPRPRARAGRGRDCNAPSTTGRRPCALIRVGTSHHFDPIDRS